jgi:hypothetical protein
MKDHAVFRWAFAKIHYRSKGSRLFLKSWVSISAVLLLTIDTMTLLYRLLAANYQTVNFLMSQTW